MQTTCADRLDLQFAAKEVCRFMSAPTETSVGALKRMGRCLLGHKWLVYTYPWQAASGIDVYSEADWSGCAKTRKSTSGGMMSVDGVGVIRWSRTQKARAISSGEAEYYEMVTGCAEGPGLQSLAEDLGWRVEGRLWTDSSAA